MSTKTILALLLPLAAFPLWQGDHQAHAGHEMTPDSQVTEAVAVMVPVGDSGVSGTIHFQQKGDSIHVTGEVKGLTPGKHGFHVHQYGDLTDAKTGKSAGGHYSPEGMPHGMPSDAKRHVGDLGNIEADESGVAHLDITDKVIELNGAHSIVGRGLVVHEKADTFVQPTGDAGGRVAFGAIGIAQPAEGAK